jgi:hypothetical protein
MQGEKQAVKQSGPETMFKWALFGGASLVGLSIFAVIAMVILRGGAALLGIPLW